MAPAVRLGRVWLSPALAVGLVALILAAVRVPEARWFCVLLAGTVVSLLGHETGHALAARHQGYDVDRIELSLVGGRAVWSGDDHPDAHTAAVIAAAGPAASAVLAAGFALAGAEVLAGMNIGAALVNLVPVRGLDGAVLWRALRTSSAPEP